MTSVNAERMIASAQMPAIQSATPSEIEASSPEVIEVSKTSFKLIGTKITVTLNTDTGKPVRFTIGLDKFLVGITAAVAFLNTHISQVFDLIGGP